MIKLYDYFRSSAAYRVRIALNLKQLPVEVIPIHLVNNGGEQFSAMYRAINPQSLVPAIVHDEKILTQSLAIIQYLDSVKPTPALLPKDAYEKALVEGFALAIAADIHPLNNRRVLQYLQNELKITKEQETKWYQHWIQVGFAALESQMVKHNHGRAFCFGDTPTLADICLVPQMFNARRFAVDVSAYPNLVRIDQKCQDLQAFKDAEPKEEHA